MSISKLPVHRAEGGAPALPDFGRVRLPVIAQAAFGANAVGVVADGDIDLGEADLGVSGDFS